MDATTTTTGPMIFEEEVLAMRKAQREYFKTRSREALIDSKQREARVDKLLAAYEVSNCTCRNIQLADPRRHFKGCSERAPIDGGEPLTTAQREAMAQAIEKSSSLGPYTIAALIRAGVLCALFVIIGCGSSSPGEELFHGATTTSAATTATASSSSGASGSGGGAASSTASSSSSAAATGGAGGDAGNPQAASSSSSATATSSSSASSTSSGCTMVSHQDACNAVGWCGWTSDGCGGTWACGGSTYPNQNVAPATCSAPNVVVGGCIGANQCADLGITTSDYGKLYCCPGVP